MQQDICLKNKLERGNDGCTAWSCTESTVRMFTGLSTPAIKIFEEQH